MSGKIIPVNRFFHIRQIFTYYWTCWIMSWFVDWWSIHIWRDIAIYNNRKHNKKAKIDNSSKCWKIFANAAWNISILIRKKKIIIIRKWWKKIARSFLMCTNSMSENEKIISWLNLPFHVYQHQRDNTVISDEDDRCPLCLSLGMELKCESSSFRNFHLFKDTSLNWCIRM